MGYSTTFKGEIRFNRPLTSDEAAEVTNLCTQRHDDYAAIMLPSIHCDWELTPDRQGLRWNGSEKSYEMDAWLELIISHMLDEWDVIANGTVDAQGQHPDDVWRLHVEDNFVRKVKGVIVFEDAE